MGAPFVPWPPGRALPRPLPRSLRARAARLPVGSFWVFLGPLRFHPVLASTVHVEWVGSGGDGCVWRSVGTAWPESVWEGESLANVSGPEASSAAPWGARPPGLGRRLARRRGQGLRTRHACPCRDHPGRPAQQPPTPPSPASQHTRPSVRTKRHALLLPQCPAPVACCPSAGSPKGPRDRTGRQTQGVVTDSFCPAWRAEPLGSLVTPAGDCSPFLRCSGHARLAVGREKKASLAPECLRFAVRPEEVWPGTGTLLTGASGR